MLRRRYHENFWRSRRKGKKMREFGKVDLPQEAFIAALKVDS